MRLKKSIGIFVCLLHGWSLNADYATVFVPRQITFDATFELALTNFNTYYAHEEHSSCEITVQPLYQKSTNKNSLAKFFLPNNAPCAVVRQDGLGNIDSLWFDVLSAANTDFSSTICLQPIRTSYGACFDIVFDIQKLAHGLWISLNFAALGVRHNLHMSEYNVENPGTLEDLQTMIEALNNPEWEFGKLSACPLKAAGVDDIQIKLGYDWYTNEDENDHVGLYLVAGIPTAKKPTDEYLFEAVVGTNHAQFGCGATGSVSFLEHTTSQLALMADVKYLYAFGAQEQRSFDLTPNGKWSRFLQLVMEQTPNSPEPGINLLSFPSQVIPRSSLEIWLAAHYTWDHYHLEIGYDFWWRQREKVHPNYSIPDDLGIYDLAGAVVGIPISGSKATISQSATGPHKVVSDAFFTPITNANINIRSAEHPQALSSKLYGASAYTTELYSQSIMLGIAGSYEFAHKNSTLSQWALWTDIGIEF